MNFFQRIANRHFESIGVELTSFSHQLTGAVHHHFACDDEENVFMVAFRTVPEDSSGVAHILEHTVLCGSARYPVRDPFFLMTRRSLNTFMNAFTASDWTAYPFATCNRIDFFNLLDVYLDAAFFPNIEALDFAQEGWRYDFVDSGNIDSDLMYKGVVFNEMKGAMSTQSRILWHKLCAHVYPNVTYHHNSGGDPEDIPKLTWEQLKDFHKKHYHPSNAIFLTYGNLDAETLQKEFEEKVLSQFQRTAPVPLVALEKPLSSALSIEEEYALDEEKMAARTHIVVSWLWGESSDIKNVLRAHLLSGVLFDNGAAPLREVLETTELGKSLSPICGLEDEHRQMQFTLGLEGSETQYAEKVEQLILNALEDIANNGVNQHLVEAVLHQLELGQRSMDSGGYPYGLSLIMSALTAAIHGGDVGDRVDIDTALKHLREECSNHDFVPNLIREWLLENTHRVTLTLKPNNKLNAQQEQAEKQRLHEALLEMSVEEKNNIVEFNSVLEKHQIEEQDSTLLPKVGIEDVKERLDAPVKYAHGITPFAYTSYKARTNGLIYANAWFDLPKLDANELSLLPLLAGMIGELGSGGRNYLQTQEAQALYTGGIGASVSLSAQISDVNHNWARFGIGGKGLDRNLQSFMDLLSDTLWNVRFDEHQRILELLTQCRYQIEQGVVQQGHLLAMNAASSHFNAIAGQNYNWGGLKGIQRTIQYQKKFEKHGVADFSEDLKKLYSQINTIKPEWLLIGDEKGVDDLQQQMTTFSGKGIESKRENFLNPIEHQSVNLAWSVFSKVNYCAHAYPAVPSGHQDAPVLSVLANFLRNGYLHTAIREQGGAYGGGAQYDSESASFRFFSYRDPRLEETLADFRHSIHWLFDASHNEEALEQAILNVVSKIDAPSSPAGEVKKSFFSSLDGRTLAIREKYRQQVLNTTLDDLQRVANNYLKEEPSSTVVCSKKTAENLSDKGFVHESINEENN